MLVDTKTRYGTVTRFLHWLMTVGFMWMLFTATVHFIDRDSALNEAVWRFHPLVGFTMLMLGVIRIIWLLSQRARRPDNNFNVRLGHFSLYVLMVLTPTLAFMRSEEHTSELQSRGHLVCRLLLEKKKYSRTSK